MKESPVIFSTPMILAILDGRKTQTRRIVKGFARTLCAPDMFTQKYVAMPENGFCPYGYAGDTLWVRETFCQDTSDGKSHFWVYKADCPDYPMGSSTWKPSIHMPRAAARIFLEITALRIEPLQDISREDAIAEGVFDSDAFEGYCTDNDGRNFHASDPRISFCKLWCIIHSPESWDENPFVWVIDFKKI